jgi:hypothetical protein
MADEVKLKPTPINPIEIKGAIAFSAEHARIWAEGTDFEVEKLGGEHSAKGWASASQQASHEYTDEQIALAKQELTDSMNIAVNGAVNTAKSYTDNEVSAETLARQQAVSGEAETRALADNNLQSQIDALSAASDVKDIVGTYSELQAYDTSTLGDNDIIKVLDDSTHGDAPSYYRWDATDQQFEYIGSESASYTKAEANTKFLSKTEAASTYLSQTDAADTYATKTSLATVATSGSYNDLSNKPTIPTVNNSTITLTQGGTTKGYFKLNQSSDATIALDAGGSALPSQTGHSGEFLTTDGTDASWAPISIPSKVWTQENLIAGDNTTITKLQQPVYGDTLGLWHLNDATTDEVHGNNLVTGSGSFVSGGKFSNFAFQNSYGNSYIDIGELLDNESAFTIDWWFSWPGSHNTIFFTTEDQAVPGSGAGLRNISWGHSTGGTIMYFNNNENKQYPSSIVNGWNHVALCVNLTQGIAYYIINGQTYNSATIPSGSSLYGKTSFGNLCRRICVYAETKSSEIRLSKGLVWTQSDVPFTPPSEPYEVPEQDDIYQINAVKYEGPTLNWYTGNTGTSVTIADTTGANLVKVYKNGVLLQPTVDYSVSGTTLTLVTALESTDKIAVEVF